MAFKSYITTDCDVIWKQVLSDKILCRLSLITNQRDCHCLFMLEVVWDLAMLFTTTNNDVDFLVGTCDAFRCCVLRLFFEFNL